MNDQTIALGKCDRRAAERTRQAGAPPLARHRIADRLGQEAAQLLDDMGVAAEAEMLVIEAGRRRLAAELPVEADGRGTGETAEQSALQ